MNDGRPARTTISAVSEPQAAPARMAATIAKPIGRPSERSTQLITMMETASTAPTERSIPPMRITRVMPRAMMPSTVTWSRMLRRLLRVRKLSVVTLSTTHSRSRPSSGPVMPDADGLSLIEGGIRRALEPKLYIRTPLLIFIQWALLLHQAANSRNLPPIYTSGDSSGWVITLITFPINIVWDPYSTSWTTSQNIAAWASVR
ncbi:hypothetical protein D9M68_685420 [compost metagenome]